MRYKFLSLMALGVFSTFSFAEDSFKNFKQEFMQGVYQEQKEYEQYKKQIEKEFKEYKRIVYEEFEKYKKEVSRYWDEPEISTNKKFVEYSKDYSVKKVIDFEKSEIKIEVIADKNKTVDKKKFALLLYDLITEDTKTAYKRDKVSQNIEKRLKKSVKNLKVSKVPAKPIVMDMVVPKKNPSVKDVNKTVIDLLKKAKFKKRKSKKLKNKNIFSVKIKLPPKRILIKAKKYKPLARKYSQKYNLKTELILAVIHTESAFNPLAKSWVPAYGLMQIVPQTAGKDATRIIYGRPVLLSPSFLYNDKNNILVGSTYLYLLYHKYLKSIKDPVSRLYCTIAAYNTGAGNVARAFTGTTSIKRASKVINRMSPSQVYYTLLRKLPYKETKHYLKKVHKRMQIYANL